MTKESFNKVLKKWYVQVPLILTFITTSFGALTWAGSLVFHGELHEIEGAIIYTDILKDSIIPYGIKELEIEKQKIDSILDWMERKEQSYSVGLRVDGAGVIWYRDKEGELYRVHYDAEYDYYYYNDNNDIKRECH